MLHLSCLALPGYVYNSACAFPFLSFPSIDVVARFVPPIQLFLILQLLQTEVRSRVIPNLVGLMGYYFYYNFLYVWIVFRCARAATSAMKTLIVMPRPLFQTSVYEY